MIPALANLAVILLLTGVVAAIGYVVGEHFDDIVAALRGRLMR